MAKKKVAILGGGMAGLSAAYELTKTQELRALHEVTIYQMGWRLGGKAASGRDACGRNLEHGLHVWFGCYENVFRLTREIYQAWKSPPGCPLKSVEDVAKPQVFTPIGVEHNGKWMYFPLEWPVRPGVPGDGGDISWTPREALAALSSLFMQVVRDGAAERFKLHANGKLADRADAKREAVSALPQRFKTIVSSANFGIEERGRGESLWQHSQTDCLSFEQSAEVAHLWTKALLTRGTPVDTDSVDDIFRLHDLAFAELEPVVRGAAELMATSTPIDLKLRLIWELINIFGALTRGFLLDLILPDRSFETLDHLDLREWLKGHGAKPEIVDQSSILRLVYDTLFQFNDGDVTKPSYAAGTALGVIARLVVTYKSAMMWDIQAGMGEALIAPLYEVLRDRGVSFRFFHKAKKLSLSDDKRSIDKVTFKLQAKVTGGDYKPVNAFGGLSCWPHEPFWNQLEDGLKLQKAGYNFENHWADAPNKYDDIVLVRGTDFDVVILAISMGAYKPLNSEDESMCAELIAEDGPFAHFVSEIGIVPTQSLQLWSDKTLVDMGWTAGKPATVSGPEYLNIWADMTQVIPFEAWTCGPRPKSLHYLCGTLATDQYKRPASDRAVPKAILTQLRKEQIAWLNDRSAALWPLARSATKFDFGILNDPTNKSGEARFDAQYFRANVSPTECCVLSAAGTTKFRLHAHESGVDNLILAGEATRHGFNTTAIEGAVMSGMAASRAICESPLTIHGYDFLQRRPSQSALVEERKPPARLRPFTSWVGHGGASLAQPCRFTGSKVYAFAVKANTSAMQRLVDKFLNANTDGSVSYHAAGPLAFATFMNVEKCTSIVDAIGWVPGRECALWVPLTEVKRGHLLRRPVLWAPYVFINYTIGMLTGREVWGWPKVLGDITMGDTPGANANFACSTMTLDRLDPLTEGKVRKLICVTGDAPLTRHSGLGALTSGVIGFAANIMNAAAPLVGAHRLPTIPAIVLKQFRDVQDADGACYQAIVNSPVQVTRIKGGGTLTGSFKLHIATCESHQIAKDFFGQEPTVDEIVVPVASGAWAELDFDALAGDVIFGGGS